MDIHRGKLGEYIEKTYGNVEPSGKTEALGHQMSGNMDERCLLRDCIPVYMVHYMKK